MEVGEWIKGGARFEWKRVEFSIDIFFQISRFFFQSVFFSLIELVFISLFLSLQFSNLAGLDLDLDLEFPICSFFSLSSRRSRF